MASTQAEERFAALLQPIRDLAQTWNIDVAHELEEYLVRKGLGSVPAMGTAACDSQALTAALHGPQEELESITFTFEDGPSLNFAEGVSAKQRLAAWAGPRLSSRSMLTL